MKIDTIMISGIRGIPSSSDFNIECDGKHILIYGENGVGKSSIVDALEFFFTGGVSRFKRTAGVTFDQHCPHKNCKPEDMRVEVKIRGLEKRLTRTPGKNLEARDDLKRYLEPLEDGTFILRRAQILNFIVSPPAKRYNAIAKMIGIEYLDSIESAMTKVEKDLEKESTQKDGQIREITERFNKEDGWKIIELSETLGPINSMLETVGLPLLDSLDDIEAYLAKPESFIQDTRELDSYIKKCKTFNDIPHNVLKLDFSVKLTKLRNFISNHDFDKRREMQRIMSIIETGKDYLSEDGQEICPLCMQGIHREKLLMDLESRLGEMRQYNEESAAAHQQSKEMASHLREVARRLKQLIFDTREYEELEEPCQRLEENIRSLRKYSANLENIDLREIIVDIEEYGRCSDEIEYTLKEIDAFGKTVISTSEPRGKEGTRTAVLLKIAQVNDAKNRIKRLECEKEKIKKEQSCLSKIHTPFSELRKDHIQTIYNSILTHVERYYKRLHPNDPIKGIRLSILTEKKASCEIAVDFGEKENEDPRAFLSEGHLDSLGLCIFMAFMKGTMPDSPIIVLDDVVTTIDSGHRDKICGLIYEEFSDSQVIITTHDGIWYDQLRNYQSARKIPSVNLELYGWTPEGGPRIRSSKSPWENVRKKLEEHDKAGAGNEGRRYLEYVLGSHCTLLFASIPFKGASYRYGAGELLDAFRSTARKTISEEDFKLHFQPCFEELDGTKYLGNLLAHNNADQVDLAIGEVESFCNAVHRLDSLFICPKCERKLQYFKDLRTITCPRPECNHKLNYRTRR